MSKAVWLQSGGNSVGGLKRTLFVFDEEALELRPVDVKRIEIQAAEDAAVKWVTENPGRAQKDVEEALPYGRETVRNALAAGRAAGRADFVSGMLAPRPGRAANGKYWYPAGHKDLRSPGDQQASISEQEGAPSW